MRQSASVRWPGADKKDAREDKHDVRADAFRV
jgi:hypothetical protein